MLNITDILVPLMIGNIAGAGLTLAGGTFLENCVIENLKKILKEPFFLISVSADLFIHAFKKLILIVVLIFLFAEVLLIGYVVFNQIFTIWISYCFFLTGILILFWIIIAWFIFFS
jgi:hypothetical protein